MYILFSYILLIKKELIVSVFSIQKNWKKLIAKIEFLLYLDNWKIGA